MVYFQFLLIRAEILFFPDVAVYRKHEVVTFDILPKKVESVNDVKNTFADSLQFVLRLSHKR